MYIYIYDQPNSPKITFGFSYPLFFSVKQPTKTQVDGLGFARWWCVSEGRWSSFAVEETIHATKIQKDVNQFGLDENHEMKAANAFEINWNFTWKQEGLKGLFQLPSQTSSDTY